ncbi:hypothetical protein [Pseudonocardia sp. ICBG601]|nr:hypothetical protein [Pseudonocardia sp. ICBG601]
MRLDGRGDLNGLAAALSETDGVRSAQTRVDPTEDPDDPDRADD